MPNVAIVLTGRRSKTGNDRSAGPVRRVEPLRLGYSTDDDVRAVCDSNVGIERHVLIL